MRRLYSATQVALWVLLSSVVVGQSYAQQPALSITNYKVKTSQRVSVTQWEYVYAADLVNHTGGALTTAKATLTTTVSNIVVTPGQNVLNFAAVADNAQVTSTNTFTILVDRTVAFNLTDLHWTYQTTGSSSNPPVANAGPDQTALVGSTVNLNGSASTNPSGVGALTYSWNFVSRPPASIAILTNPTSVTPSFLVDAPGSYIVNLTVDNGVASSSDTVAISTANTRPVANAGPDQTVALNSLVVLNGSLSSDADGNALTYAWAFTTVPAGSSATLTGANGPSPSFVADKAGLYRAQLTVNDGQLDSVPSSVNITVSPQNTPPVANPGNGQVVHVGDLVQLDGSGSTDVDGDPLTFHWTLLSAPTNSTAALSNPNIFNPTFTADKSGSYVAQLVVNDGKADSAAKTVTISTSVMAPTANPGPNQTVAHNSTVQLSGSGTDPQGLTLTYAWSLTTKPSGSTASLSATNIPNPTFVADKVPGPYIAQLIVNNGTLSSAPATVTISTTNTTPVANAGPAQTVTSGASVLLDGSGSSDADHDPLTYSWSFTSRPTGSTATLSGANTVAPIFTADVAGNYVVQLIVNDGFGSSAPTTVTITAGAKAITLSPNPLSMATTGTATLTVTLSSPAGSGGQKVNLVSSDTTKATIVASVTVAQGATTATATVTPVAVGNTTITGSATGYTSGTAAVTVAVPTASVTLDFPNVGIGGTVTGHVVLNVAPATAVGVGLSTNPTGKVTVPSSVSIAAGATTADFTVTGVALGTTTVRGVLPGYSSSTANVTVVSTPPVGVPSTLTVQSGQSVTLTVSLPTPAGASGLTVNLVSSDTTKATVPASVFIAAGNTTPATQPQVTGGAPGTATISASATGYSSASTSVTVTAGPPSTITTTSGTPQSASINAAFAALSATVKDAQGNPVSGVSVTFTAPASGASGKFGASNTTTATTNTLGVATASTFIANATAGSFTVVASATGVSPSANFSLTVTAGTATSITASAGTPQSTTISSPFLTLLQATVTDSGGNPISGKTVTFTAPATGKSGTFTGNLTTVTATTDSTGIATAPAFTANGTVGSYTVAATVSGVAGSASFALTNLSGPPTQITATAGTPQSIQVTQQFITFMQATVKDAGNNLASGVAVTFTAPASGVSGTFAGGLTTATVATNASGVAIAPAFTANGNKGTYTVIATFDNGVTTTAFTLTNNQGPPSSITATAGTPQSAKIAVAFTTALQATVKDAGGNLISGASVVFTAPTTGASGKFTGNLTSTTVTTDVNGVATAPAFTANTIKGTYSVTATTSSLTATFALTNTAGDAASITATGGTPQTVQAGAALGAAMQATVKDAGGNTVTGVNVTFTAPGSGASGTFAGGALNATVATDANGVAAAPAFTANFVLGTYTVTATFDSGTHTASFSLNNNLPGPPSTLTATSGTPQSVAISTPYASLQATVKDAGGNVISGTSVTFTAPTTGASGTFAGGLTTATATTNASGAATVAFTANGNVGPFTVVASASGTASTASFVLNNLTGPPTSITATGGTPQSTPNSTAFPNFLQATVKDAGGNTLSNVVVTFKTPTSGQSGTFANGTTTTTATTDATGVATSSQLTANGNLGAFTATATFDNGTHTASFSLTNLSGPPAQISATGGTPQSVQVAQQFATGLQATVKDAGGNLASGVSVTFTAPATGASGTFTGGSNTVTVTSNALGVATATVLTANSTTGTFTVTATFGDGSHTTSFALTNTAGAAAAIAATAGTPQSLQVNGLLTIAMQATVKDAFGNLVGSGVTVSFSAPTTGASGKFGSASTTVATTNAAGVVTAPAFTANTTMGSYNVTATVNSATATFALTNTPGAAASLTASAGSGQNAAITQPYANTLQATVKDSFGNLVSSGVSVTFTAPASNASATFAGGGTTATATTNAAGVATSPAFTANSTVGTFTITAASGTGSVNFTETNTAGPPATITATGGTPQSVKINTNFTTLLSATVKDAGGNLVGSGIGVTFTAPASGPSGAFSGSATIIATTNSAGVATATAFTANGTAGGPYSVIASSGTASTAAFLLTNLSGPAATITATSGMGQTAKVTVAYANPLKATVTDAGGNPVSNASVIFSAPGSGASGKFGTVTSVTVTTDANGVATAPTFTANSTIGPFSVTASVSGVGALASFSLTNLAGDPASIAVTAGGGQTAQILKTFTTAMQVIVKDGGTNPVNGATVTFTAPASGASGTFPGAAISATATTDSTGTAVAPAFTANTSTGTYTVAATVNGFTASFTMTNTPGAAAAVTATAGTPQSVQVTAAAGTAMQATVKDAGGNLVGSGVTVTFTAPVTGGAGGTFPGSSLTATAITNTSGVATAPAFTANGTLGTYTVTASVTGATSAAFTLTNIPGPPKAIAASSGGGQSAQILNPYTNTLQATVTDVGGNLIPNATVTFTAPGAGPSLVFSGGGTTATATTNASGVATSPAFSANGSVGPFAVTGSVTGVVTTVSYSLTNLSGPAASITMTSGSGQSAPAGTPFAAVLKVTVKDAGGNLASGAVVTFTAPATSGASGFFNGSTTAVVTTNSVGVATSPTFLADKILGTYTVVATVSTTVSGVTPANFTMTNTSAAGLPTISVSNLTVGKNLQTQTTLLLSTPAPAGTPPSGGVTLTVSSSDPTKMLVAGRQADTGVASLALGLPGGVSASTIFIQGLSSSGTASLIISGSGYVYGISTVTLTPSGFVIAGPGGLGVTTLVTNQGLMPVLSISAAQLDSSLNVVQTQSVRAGLNVNVNLTNSNPDVGTLGDTTVAFSGGTGDTVNSTFFASSANTGSTTLGVAVPAGFSQPAQDASLFVTVQASSMSIVNDSDTIGKDLEVSARVLLAGVAPDSNLIVTLTSNSQNLLLSKTPDGAGSSSISITVNAGFSNSPFYYVQALGNTGTASYTATAPGFGTTNKTVTLTPSGFVISGPSGFGSSSFLTTTLSDPSNIAVSAAMLDSSNNFVTTQAIRGGFTAQVPINTSDNTVGTVPSPVSIPAGTATVITQFQPGTNGNCGGAACQTVLSLTQPSGFSTPTSLTSVTANVTIPGMFLTADGAVLGKDLQGQVSVVLGAAAPAGGLQVTITSTNTGALLVSDSLTNPGTASVTITIPAGATNGSFFLQALGSSGIVQIQAVAQGFNNRNANITLAHSGVVLGGPLGFSTNYNTTVASGPSTFTVYAAQLDGSNKYVAIGTLRPGISVQVSLNANAAVGTIVSPVTIAAGTGSVDTTFTPVHTGTTNLSLSAPSNFGLATNFTLEAINVTN